MNGDWDRIYDYARVSTNEQAQGQSLEQQIARLSLTQPIASQLFQDTLSGNNNDRPGYLALKKQVREDALNGLKVLVRVTRLDRLSRNDREIDDTIEDWGAIGVDLFALDGGFYRSKDATDWLRTKQEGILAQFYLRQLSTNIKRGKDYKRRLNRPLGKPPFGYQSNQDKTQLVPHPDQWGIARQIVEAYLDGRSLRECMATARAIGWKISVSGLKEWLTCPTLRGHLAYTKGGYTLAERKRGVKKRPEIQAWNVHKALITEAEYKQIIRQLEENRRKWGINASGKGRVYPLSGLCFCAECGYRMSFTTQVWKGMDHAYVRCQRKVCAKSRCSASLVEDAVQEKLMERAESIARLVLTPDTPIESPELLQLRQQLDGLKEMQDRSPHLPLGGAIEQLEVQIKNAASQPVTDSVVEDFQKISGLITQPIFWEETTPQEAKRIYQLFVEKIVLQGRSIVEIQLKV